MFKNFSKKPYKLAKIRPFLAIIMGVIALSGCIKNTDLVGYTFKSEKLDEIRAGQTTQEGVRQILGSPSISSAFGEKTWYYISSEYTTVAFLSPKIKEQKIFGITFNDKNLVTEIKEYSEQDVKDVKITSEVTKSVSDSGGVISQLLGNVGRFNSDPGKPRTINKPRSVPK